jgi:dinuclear metal center YbgI/SA1388 family protein
MTIKEFDQWIYSILPMVEYCKIDKSLNGLQFGQKDTQITGISFALDAAALTIEAAHRNKSNVLFVHHGLFWGQPQAIVDDMYHKIKLLSQYNIALYAVHLPLDADMKIGNNATVANLLQLTQRQTFADGLGVLGVLPKPLSPAEIAQSLFDASQNYVLWPNKKQVQKVGILVGGGSHYVTQAVNLGAECFITGEALHQVYHYCLENEIAMIGGGHYASEMLGMKAFYGYVSQTFSDIPTNLIDHKTGV